MSESNQDQTGNPLGNLENIILGSLNSHSDAEGDDFSRLQEMLVDPEVLRMRERMSRVESHLPEVVKMKEKFTRIEQQFDDLSALKAQLEQLESDFKQFEESPTPKDIIKLIVPIMSKIMNRQLNQFKQEILEAIVPIVEEYQQNQRQLSIRVVGIDPESGDPVNVNN